MCFFCILISRQVSGQENNGGKKSEGSSFVMLSLGYRMPVHSGNILRSGRGLALELGLNPGKFISGGLVLGVYVGWCWRDVLWNSSFQDDFKKDYQHQVNNGGDNLSNSPDSSIIRTSAVLFGTQRGRAPVMPNCETRSFHDYSLYYGIMIALPFRNCPLLKLYTGFTRAHYQGNGEFDGTQYDYTIFQLRRPVYGAELMLFRGFRYERSGKKGDLRLAALSLYYEQSDFTRSSLYFDNGQYTRSIGLETFCTPDFLSKYRTEIRYGLKLSFYIL